VIEGMHQIGEVAEVVGLSLRTIRHYEEVGLVPPSGRSAGGFRLYTGDDIERLRLVKQMKPLDFPLEEMRELLELRDRLADGAGGQEHAGLVDRLELFAATAEQRCQTLQDQLDAAQAMAQTLRREARRHRSAVRR